MSWVSRHLNAIVFGVGVGFLYVGAWHWSIGAANLLLGTIAVIIGVHPFVLRLWR